MYTLATIDRGRRSPRGSDGFTLAETLAVMVIIAIMAAAAVPAMTNLGDMRATTAGQLLAQDVAFAREYAIATGTITWVFVDPATETWTLKAETGAAGKANAVTMSDPATNANYARTLGIDEFPDVAITTSVFDASTDIGFDWQGEPLSADATPLAANGTITITGPHTVTVEKGTGLVAYVP